jgi:REP-associated tyrosine transposase
MATHTNLVYHIVFATKNREPLITPIIRDNLYSYIGGIIRNTGGTSIEIGGMPDHVHLLVNLRPDLAVAEALRLIKTNSSKWANDNARDGQRFAWQTSYAAFSVSTSRVSGVQRYIQRQEAHHRRVSFEEEYVRFLERHGIAYDERYLWE